MGDDPGPGAWATPGAARFSPITRTRISPQRIGQRLAVMESPHTLQPWASCCPLLHPLEHEHHLADPRAGATTETAAEAFWDVAGHPWRARLIQADV